MAITLLLPTDVNVHLVKSEQIICTDETHLHNSPIQNMIGLDVNGHYVEITEDGDSYNVRIDDHHTTYDLTIDQLDQFVKDNTP